MNVFVSYSRQDSAIVDRITAALKEDKHDIWIDRLRLTIGDNIEAETEKGLANADALIVVLSENSFRSQWVQREVAAIALQGISARKRPIYPIRIDKTPIPNYLANLFVLDISDDFEGGIQRLRQALQHSPSKASQEKQRSVNVADNRLLQMSELRGALREGRLTLVCGAGVSVDAGVPAWSMLLLGLLERMMPKIAAARSISIDSKAAKEFQEKNASSALILGKYLKNTFGSDFSAEIRDVLYRGNPTTCPLIESIVSLSRARRDGKPLNSILTYNFDSLIEENLTKAEIPNQAIFSDSVRHRPNAIPIYHVHGYLPRGGSIPDESSLVFSEDAYHTQFVDPFSWSNLIQLNKWTENTCLFIGISLTDPNMRRLLDIAWRKNREKNLSHFIVKRSPKPSATDKIGEVTKILEEQDANGLGLKVIWIDQFDELAPLIAQIAPPD